MSQPGNVGAATQQGGPPMAPEPVVYQAGGLRKVILAFVFLLLLPFFVSLPVMLYQRLAKGALADTWGLIVLAAGFTLVMLFLLFELIYSIRARIMLGENGIRLSVPAGRFGMPALVYRRAEIPYSEIASVETRCEIYGGAIAPVLMRQVRVVTKSGEQHSLGYVSEADTDPLFPLKDIAECLCRNCGVQLVERESVRRPTRRLFMGLAEESGNVPVTSDMVAQLNRNHNRFMLGLVGVMVALLAAGIIIDFSTAEIDRGERARDAVQAKKTVTPPKK
ncbi:MAG TPA: hypothetical protein VNK52_06815 [Hyphomicrobiaceae bacterium]|nr:hypothetical protein [Hyphomicrobiaceae bacterium]